METIILQKDQTINHLTNWHDKSTVEDEKPGSRLLSLMDDMTY